MRPFPVGIIGITDYLDWYEGEGRGTIGKQFLSAIRKL